MRLRTIPSLSWTIAAAAAIFALKAAFIIATPVRALGMTPWIIDDSFIIMRTARNIALGLGFTYDGVHSTTGSPFLWTYLTSINHLLFSRDLAIQMTFVESAFFAGIATVVVYALAYAVTGRFAIAATAFALVTFTSNAFFAGLNGMDTALFTFLVLAAIAAAFDLGRPHRTPPFAWGCVIGMLAGVATLVRADGVFVTAAIVLLQLWDAVRAGRRAERTSALALLSGTVFAAGALTAVLAGWNAITTGSPLPGNQVGRRAMALSLHNFSFDQFSLARYLRIVAYNTLQLETLLHIALGSTLLALLGTLYGGLGTLEVQLKRLIAVSVLYCVLFFGSLVAYQWYFPDFHGLRYINPGVHLLLIGVAALLVAIPLRRCHAAMTICMSAAIVLLSWTSFRALAQRMPWTVGMNFVARPTAEEQEKFWRALDWVRDHLPPGTRVGVRDHGRFALFTDLPVQDLAGNVDPIVTAKIRDGTLPQFLKERSIEYLFIPSLEERQDALYRLIYAKIPLIPVKEAPSDRSARLYRIDWKRWKPS